MFKKIKMRKIAKMKAREKAREKEIAALAGAITGATKVILDNKIATGLVVLGAVTYFAFKAIRRY